MIILFRLSPAKRLSRDQIPYSQLRTVIGDFVAKQKGSTLINSITGMIN
jgi:hypothetical protein